VVVAAVFIQALHLARAVQVVVQMDLLVTPTTMALLIQAVAVAEMVDHPFMLGVVTEVLELLFLLTQKQKMTLQVLVVV
jgi:hypothetical protein